MLLKVSPNIKNLFFLLQCLVDSKGIFMEVSSIYYAHVENKICGLITLMLDHSIKTAISLLGQVKMLLQIDPQNAIAHIKVYLSLRQSPGCMFYIGRKAPAARHVLGPHSGTGRLGLWTQWCCCPRGGRVDGPDGQHHPDSHLPQAS